MGEVGYKKLIVWQKADEFAFQVYTTIRDFPKDEIYGITSQLRRAALSVPTNIVEGYGRGGRKELRQFLNISLGSLAEAKYLLSFLLRLKYLDSATYTQLQDLAEEVGKLLWRFYEAQCQEG
jgi:four helix bundle protein